MMLVERSSSGDPVRLYDTPVVEPNTCSPTVPVAFRNYVVQLFQLIPWDERKPAFKLGAYPFADALANIGAMDPAADEYRHREAFFGNERFCLFDSNGPASLICLYTKDVTSAPEFEFKGEVKQLELDDGAGLVDAAYAMLFPNDVVALMRTSPKSPGSTFLSAWMSEMGGTRFMLQPLPNPNVFVHLSGAAGLIRKFRLAGRLRTTPDRDERKGGFAERLRREANEYPGQTEAIIERSNRSLKLRHAFAEQFNDDLFEIFELVPQLREAKVWLTGHKRPIDLKGAHLTVETPTGLTEFKRVNARLAATALMEMYGNEQQTILAAAKQVHEQYARRLARHAKAR